jgi:hypothetical protein
MSTHDVPGAVPAHQDKLAMGCWAEHEDGSLLFVESTEGGRVIYSIFNMAVTPPVEFRDAMPQKGFEDLFSISSSDTMSWTPIYFTSLAFRGAILPVPRTRKGGRSPSVTWYEIVLTTPISLRRSAWEIK